MTQRSWILSSLVALALLAATAASASAFTETVAPGASFVAASLGKITFENSLSVACNLTLTGNLLRGPITIARGERVGSITGGSWANCEGGEIEDLLVDAGIPWPITINSVPAPELGDRLRIHHNNFAVEFGNFGGFIECLYQGNVPANLLLSGNGAGTYTTGLLLVLSNTFRLARPSFGCPNSGALRGTFGLTRQTMTVS